MDGFQSDERALKKDFKVDIKPTITLDKQATIEKFKNLQYEQIGRCPLPLSFDTEDRRYFSVVTHSSYFTDHPEFGVSFHLPFQMTS